MDYKVLYRKYRPQSFDDVVGQEYIKQILKSSIMNNKINHAYLFCGPRGTGKTSVAKIFARTINCLAQSDGNPCLKCASCIMENNPDVLEIDAASNNGVDEIRELRNNVRLAPACSKYKIYIIDEVHMLSAGAFNALLKTLEEPPQNIIFILATTEIQKVPITIMSRCQRLDFKRISENDIIEQMKRICKKEKIVITDDALLEIAKIADGGMRDALSLLDQLSSKNAKITVDDILEVTASISIKEIESINSHIINNDISVVEELAVIDDMGIDFSIFANKYISYLKDILITAIKNSDYSKEVALEKKIMSLLTNIVINSKKLINGYSLFVVKILELIDIPVEQESEPVYADENSRDETVVTEETEIEKKSENVGNVESEEFENNLELIKQARINNTFCGVSKDDKKDCIANWKRFTEELKDSDLASYALVDSLSVEAASKTHILLSSGIESQMLLANQKSDIIEKKYNKMFKTDYKIVVVTLPEWNDIKKDFINNKDKVYSFMDESCYKKEDNIKKSIAYEIFDNNKIVIK